MCNSIRKLLLVSLSFLLLSVFSVVSLAEDRKLTIYESELTQLVQISQKLEILNKKLLSELQSLKTNFSLLSNNLESSMNEANELKKELGILKTNSVILYQQLEVSQLELENLSNLLVKAESSLNSLQVSFKEYSKEVDNKIKELEFQRNLSIVLGIIGTTGGIILAILL